jgi:hypothetical protein
MEDGITLKSLPQSYIGQESEFSFRKRGRGGGGDEEGEGWEAEECSKYSGLRLSSGRSTVCWGKGGGGTSRGGAVYGKGRREEEREEGNIIRESELVVMRYIHIHLKS